MTSGGQGRVMVLGVGNPDRGDDGVGPAVLDRLRGRLPAGAEGQVSGGDFLNLINDWAEVEGLVVVDAAAALGTPGRVHRIDATSGDMPLPRQPASSHAFGLPEAIALARSLGQAPGQIVVLAVEGEDFATGAGLSPMVAAAVDGIAVKALDEVLALLGLEASADA